MNDNHDIFTLIIPLNINYFTLSPSETFLKTVTGVIHTVLVFVNTFVTWLHIIHLCIDIMYKITTLKYNRYSLLEWR